MRHFQLVLTVIACSCVSDCAAQTAAEPDSTRTELTEFPRGSMSGEDLFNHQWVSLTQDDFSQLNRQRVTAAQAANINGDPRLRQRLLSQRSAFRHGDGLGPLHNATSCAQCHINGGGSGVDHNVTVITIDPRSEVFEDVTLGGQLLEVFPGVLNSLGAISFTTVVHDRSTRPGYNRIRERLTEYVPGGIDKTWMDPPSRTSQAIAERPVIAGRHLKVDFYLSQRNAPSLHGLGDIDRISNSRLNQIAKRQAQRTDGKITGRVAGKFGWRGQVASLSAFVNQACAGELGLSSTATRQVGDPADFAYTNIGNNDITDTELASLTSFVSSIPRPIEVLGHGGLANEIYAGDKLFHKIGCADCHIADVRPVSGLFSDLLLHDMGERLQGPDPAPVAGANMQSVASFTTTGPSNGSFSNGYYGGMDQLSAGFPQPMAIAKPDQPQFPRGASTVDDSRTTWDSLQREWRTPPLWGIASTAPYLHDGRATTLEAAIEWHGGEGTESRQNFQALSKAEQGRVIKFLLSLKAPE